MKTVSGYESGSFGNKLKRGAATIIVAIEILLALTGIIAILGYLFILVTVHEYIPDYFGIKAHFYDPMKSIQIRDEYNKQEHNSYIYY